ncbi:MAG: TetR/AcrR family transcriptional regulator [Spirochaetaceae bacterium]|nr:MAG: TetR/AcrR family transcriptional regulator [Spirochaetaceae bacterium]
MHARTTTKKRRLIERAKELFIAHGYRTVSVEQIAEAAGISKVTLYAYAGSKEELFIRCVEEITDEHYEGMRRRLETMTGSIARLEEVFAYNLEQYEKYSMSFYKDMMETPHVWKEIIQYRKTHGIAILERILVDGIESGELRRVNIEHTVRLLMILGEALPRAFPLHEKNAAEEFIRTYYDFIRHALINNRPGGN